MESWWSTRNLWQRSTDAVPLVTRIDHITVAVKDLDTAVKTFTANFGFPVVERQEALTHGSRHARLQVGSAQLELLTPTRSDHPAAAFLAERGEGMHTLSLEVENLEQAIRGLASRGIPFGPVTQTPDGCRAASISPSATHGVLLELVERSTRSAAADVP